VKWLILTLVMNMSAVGQVPIEGLVWGAKGQAHVDGAAVPEGKIWLIRAAGIFTNDGTDLEWMLEIKHVLNGSSDPNNWWLIPLQRTPGKANGTPVLALTREVVLTAGERLTARCNGLRPDRQMGLNYVGWELPASDLERVIFR
jgi:hypothetical protein